MTSRPEPMGTSELTLDHTAATPLYKQLYERLRDQILAGQLTAGIRLPSTRALADALGVSRNTAALAYELLQLEGCTERPEWATARGWPPCSRRGVSRIADA